MLFKEESVFLFESIFQWRLGLFHFAFQLSCERAWQIISKQFPLFITEYPEDDDELHGHKVILAHGQNLTPFSKE